MQTVLRHFITALGGVFLVDTSNTQAFVFGLVCLFFTWLWSVASKLEWTEAIHVSDDVRNVGRKALAALISQGLAALSGYMLAHGFEGDPNDPAAVMLFLANLGASRIGWTQKLVGLKPVLVAVLGSWFLVLGCSCSITSQEAFKQRLEVALVSAGREVSAVALGSTIATLKSELALLEAKPVDEDPLQQLVDQNRMQAIKAAIRLGEERLAKLRSSKAVIEVNPVSSFNVRNTSVPAEGLDRDNGGAVKRFAIRQDSDRVKPPVRTPLPLYAPLVVASLSASH